MAIVDVMKMSVIALQSDKEKIIKLLQRLGKVEIIDIKEKMSREEWENLFISKEHTKDLMTLQEKLADIQFALDFMGRYSRVKRSLLADKPVYSEEELEGMARSRELWDVIKECRELEAKLNGLKSEEMKLNNTIEMLRPWEGLDVPLEEIKHTDNVAMYLGTLPTGAVERVKELLAERAPESHLQVVSVDREFTNLFLAYHKSLEEAVWAVLEENSWSKVELPGVEGTPAQAISRAEESIEEFENIRNQIAQRALSLSGYRDKLEALYDYFNVLMDRRAAVDSTGDTGKAFYLEGWVAGHHVQEVRKTIMKQVPEAHVEFTQPGEEEDVPVVLTNPKLVEPFEVITELYSPPSRKDIDPNILVAPFFFIFFGMMISDAGYGLILALLGFWALKALKPSGMAKKLFGLIALGGVSTFFWGAMFGGWFGDLIKIPALWMNPLQDPMSLLIFSFILGIVQIYFGLGAAAYKNIREGKVLDAVFDQGLWFVFLTGLIMFALPSMAGIAKPVSIAGAAGLVLTQGRSKKNIIGKLSSGLLSLYGVTGYLSDVLSYSRILALGLATGVIGMVINTMAKMLGFNIIGYLLMAVVLVVGHVFNIAINALGAYVHSSRLQYVEFFSKFYEGGGRTFNPFRLNTKYTNLLSEEEI